MSFLDRAARFLDDVVLLPEDQRVRLERALAEGDARAAERGFREALEARPQLHRARVGWARALLALGDASTARIAIAEARQTDPEDPALAVLAAHIALEAGDLATAIVASREATRRLGSDQPQLVAEACVVRARAEWRRGRPDRAVRELKKAIAATGDRIVELPVELVEALVDSGEVPQAVRLARGLLSRELPDPLARRLGLALFRAGESELAETLLARPAAQGDTEALGAMARVHIARGDLERAQAQARMAVARGGGAKALALLADVLERSGREAEAADALRTAAESSTPIDRALLVRAASIVPLTDATELARYADALGALVPAEPLAPALRAAALALAGDAASAAAIPLLAPTSARASIAEALTLVRTGRVHEALAALDRAELDPALRPTGSDRTLHASLRREALRALWTRKQGEVDLAAAIDGVSTFARERGLGDLERRAQGLRDELDRPLVLAILGEFNAGKSTLVNAIVGAEVAPTGILPTTATLNLLRGGAERRVRVVRKDGTTREGGYGDTKALLADAEGEGAIVDHVEIVLPSELLERVWILDTPGSNAPHPEHEALAREALRRADAALWIFDAGQAGKATEGRVLESIQKSRREVVAALNKVDRLRAGELDQVVAQLVKEVPAIHGASPVALSARAAFKARVSGDAQALEESGFSRLLDTLERAVFSRSRELKHRACAGRLSALLDEALATEPATLAVHEEESRALSLAATRIAATEAAIASELEHAIDAIEAGQSQAFVDAAREVLSFVRPRTSRLGTHATDPEDRAFLRDAIQARLEVAADHAGTALAEAVRERLETAAKGTGLERTIGVRARAAVAPPLAALTGHQAGMLAGGALRRFFDEVLPTADLQVASIAEALAAARAHPRELLRPPLEAALASLVRDLAAEARSAADDAVLRRDRERSRTFEPLRTLREALGDLLG
jgi:tetratricopeptide (TPR) repeat protein/GTP-binding protein EngB required for normal cell division